ncbi:MAG: hypothetical protein ACFB8W_12295, partial [Elainellaceae cyanobacterium]
MNLLVGANDVGQQQKTMVDRCAVLWGCSCYHLKMLVEILIRLTDCLKHSRILEQLTRENFKLFFCWGGD